MTAADFVYVQEEEMGLTKFIPVIRDAQLDDPGADFRRAHPLEQYRVGEKALYIPDGFFKWKYIPKREIHGVIRSKVTQTGHSKIAPYCVTKPMVRIMYHDGFVCLDMEHERNAQLLKELVYDRSES